MHKYHKSCSEFIWPFYDFLQLYEENFKISYLREFSAQVSQIVFWVQLTVYDFLQLYEEKLEKSHISVSSVQKYKKSCSRLIWPF